MPDIQTIASILAAPQSTGSEFLTAEEQRRILAFQQLQKMAGATNMPIYSAGTGALKVASGALGGLMEGITERKAATEQAANSALQNKFLESLLNQNGGGSPTFGSVDPGTVPPPTPVTPPPSMGGGGPDIGGGGIAPPVDIPSPPPPIESAPMASLGPPAGSFGPVADSSQQDAILAAAQQQGITPGAGPEPFHHVADAPRIVPIPSPPPVDGQPTMAPAPGLPVPDPATSVSPMAPAVMPGDMDRGMIFDPSTPRGLAEGATVLPNAAVKPVPIGPNGEVSSLAPSSPMANDPIPRPPADVPNTGDVGSLSAKYESGGNIASAHKDNIGWAYGKWQFNSKGNLPEFFARYPAFAKSFAGLTPGTEAFNERWKMIARNDPQGFEAAQREHATHELEKPGGPLEAAAQLGFKTDNRGIYEAVWSGTQQHGGIKKVLAEAAQTPGFANMAPEDQVKAFYDARMHYVQGLAARGVPGLEGQPARYRDELKDATSLARSGSLDPNARAIPAASQQPASASPAQSSPSPQVLANALQNPQQTHTGLSRESLAMALKLMNDPRTPKAMQSAITAQVMQQLTPQKPIEVNGRLVDPRTFNVIKDFSDPKTAVVGNTVVDVRTGKPIYEGPVDPKTATVGDTVVDTRNGRTIFQGKPKPTNDIQEYNMYAEQEKAAGRQPVGFMDYQVQLKRAGAASTAITNDMRGENEFAKVAGNKQATRFDELASEAPAAKQMISDVQTLQQLGRVIHTGKGAQVRQAIGPVAEAMGITIDGLSDIQAYDSIVNRVAPTLRVKGSGAQSDFELKNFLKALPSLGNTPRGNEIIAQTMEGLQSNKLKAAEIGANALTGKIGRDEAEKQLRELPDPMEGYRSYVKSQKPESDPVKVSTPEEARKLPKGTPIILPDGTQGVVP